MRLVYCHFFLLIFQVSNTFCLRRPAEQKQQVVPKSSTNRASSLLEQVRPYLLAFSTRTGIPKGMSRCLACFCAPRLFLVCARFPHILLFFQVHATEVSLVHTSTIPTRSLSAPPFYLAHAHTSLTQKPARSRTILRPSAYRYVCTSQTQDDARTATRVCIRTSNSDQKKACVATLRYSGTARRDWIVRITM